jgi:hypothetical protein
MHGGKEGGGGKRQRWRTSPTSHHTASGRGQSQPPQKNYSDSQLKNSTEQTTHCATLLTPGRRDDVCSRHLSSCRATSHFGCRRVGGGGSCHKSRRCESRSDLKGQEDCSCCSARQLIESLHSRATQTVGDDDSHYRRSGSQ